MIIFIDPCLPIFFSEEAVNVTKLGLRGRGCRRVRMRDFGLDV